MIDGACLHDHTAIRARNKGLARSLVSNEPGELFSFDRAKTAENSPKSTDTGGFRSDFLVVVQRSAFGASFKTVLLPKSSFQRTLLRALVGGGDSLASNGNVQHACRTYCQWTRGAHRAVSPGLIK